MLLRVKEVVYLEKFEDQHKAFEREKQIKSYKGGNGFKKLLSL
jgi:predicted GIY-YIG superfamily endonuclease